MQWLHGKICLQNHKHSHLEKEAKNKNPFCNTVLWLPEQRINCIPQDKDCTVKSVTYFVSIHWYYGGWVPCLINCFIITWWSEDILSLSHCTWLSPSVPPSLRSSISCSLLCWYSFSLSQNSWVASKSIYPKFEDIKQHPLFNSILEISWVIFLLWSSPAALCWDCSAHSWQVTCKHDDPVCSHISGLGRLSASIEEAGGHVVLNIQILDKVFWAVVAGSPPCGKGCCGALLRGTFYHGMYWQSLRVWKRQVLHYHLSSRQVQQKLETSLSFFFIPSESEASVKTLF